MLIQQEIDWTIHEKENNPESQANLEDNKVRWSHQCKIIFEAMNKGIKVNNEEPKVWDDSINKLRKIGHLPRRIADIKDYLKKEGSNIIIEDGWLESGYKYYFIKR